MEHYIATQFPMSQLLRRFQSPRQRSRAHCTDCTLHSRPKEEAALQAGECHLFSLSLVQNGSHIGTTLSTSGAPVAKVAILGKSGEVSRETEVWSPRDT